jgi:hypothetical protein
MLFYNADKFSIGEKISIIMAGLLVVIPVLVLEFTAGEFGLYNENGDIFIRTKTAFIFAAALEWSIYTFLGLTYYKKRDFVSALDGIFYTLLFGLGSTIGIATIHLCMDATPRGIIRVIAMILGQLVASIIVGFYMGQSKVRYDSHDLSSWRVRFQGMLLGILMMGIMYLAFLVSNFEWSLGFIPFMVIIPMIYASTLLIRARKQYIKIQKSRSRYYQENQSYPGVTTPVIDTRAPLGV